MSQGLVIPAHVADKMNARTETCGTCKWRHQKAKNEIECRLNPPTATLNMVPVNAGPLARPGPQGMALQAFSVYAPISDDMWCGQWAAKQGNVQ